MLTVECADGKSGAHVGSAKFVLHDGRISVPAVEKRFGASSLTLGTPDGVVIDSTAAGFSNLTFEDGSTAKLFRWNVSLESDHDTSSQIHFPSFWNFHKDAQGNGVTCATTTALNTLITVMFNHAAGSDKKHD